MYYAHSTKNPDKSDWQELKTHLTNVAELSQQFADNFNAGELAYTSGLLHDLGKYSAEFQKRLEGKDIRVDHSTAGAKEATKIFNNDLQPAGILSAYLIAGHHGGLMNYGSIEGGLCERLHKAGLPDFSAYQKELQIDNHKEIRFNLKAKKKSSRFLFFLFHTNVVFLSC